MCILKDALFSNAQHEDKPALTVSRKCALCVARKYKAIKRSSESRDTCKPYVIRTCFSLIINLNVQIA